MRWENLRLRPLSQLQFLLFLIIICEGKETAQRYQLYSRVTPVPKHFFLPRPQRYRCQGRRSSSQFPRTSSPFDSACTYNKE